MICASIKKSTNSEVLTKLSEVPDDFDLVEIWLNEVENPDIESIVKNSKKPLLIKITESKKFLKMESIILMLMLKLMMKCSK